MLTTARRPRSGGARLGPASEKRNETRGKKKTGSGTERRDTHDTGPRRPRAGSSPRKSGSAGRAERAPRAPRGGSRHDPRPPPREAAADGGAAESEGEPVAEDPGSASRTNDVPTGPTAPPDPGGGRATPPGSLNLRAGTRQLGTRTGAGRTREAQKAGRDARAHHTAAAAPTHTRQTAPAPSEPEPRREDACRGGGGRARHDHRPGRDHVPPPVHTRMSRTGKRQNDHGPLRRRRRRRRRRAPRRQRRRRRRRKRGEKTEEAPRRTGPDNLPSPLRNDPPLSRNARSPHARTHDRTGPGTRLPARGHATARQGPGGRARLPLFSPLMILPQVHLRKPCYDFYFL